MNQPITVHVQEKTIPRERLVADIRAAWTILVESLIGGDVTLRNLRVANGLRADTYKVFIVLDTGKLTYMAVKIMLEDLGKNLKREAYEFYKHRQVTIEPVMEAYVGED